MTVCGLTNPFVFVVAFGVLEPDAELHVGQGYVCLVGDRGCCVLLEKNIRRHGVERDGEHHDHEADRHAHAATRIFGSCMRTVGMFRLW